MTQLSVTGTASDKVKEIRKERDRENMAVRVTCREETRASFKYTLQFVDPDEQAPGDHPIDADGVRFFVDAESAPLLVGATLDFIDNLEGTGFKFDNPNKPPLLEDPIAARVAEVIDERVNPSLASHGGHVSLLDVKDGAVHLRFGGGCQGCSMVSVTLKEGVERTIIDAVPEITQVLDSTDHDAGANPYHQS